MQTNMQELLLMLIKFSFVETDILVSAAYEKNRRSLSLVMRLKQILICPRSLERFLQPVLLILYL